MREAAVHLLYKARKPDIHFNDVINTLVELGNARVGIPKYMVGILNEPNDMGTGIRFCTLEHDLLVDLYRGIMAKKINVDMVKGLLADQTRQFLAMYGITSTQGRILNDIETAARAGNMTYLHPQKPFDPDVYIDTVNKHLHSLTESQDTGAVRGYLLCKGVMALDLLLAIQRNTAGNWV